MQHPRAELVKEKTPLDRLNNLSDDLDIDLWVKRDDVAGVPFGGNKSRQLEFYLGRAQSQGADVILITGAVQSNFVRTAAASAASLGMRTIVQLEDRVKDMDALYAGNGNVLLNRILGAEIMRYPEGEDEAGADAALRARAEELKAEGHVPYVIPLSAGNPPYGALGYMRAADEILSQDAGFDFVISPSGSGLTHGGLLSGMSRAGAKARVIGSCVRRPADIQAARMRGVLDAISELVGDWHRVGDDEIEIWDGALAPGYGKAGPAAIEAIKTIARREGLILDPVYTGKTFAAVLGLVKSGRIPQGARVVFVHTGGLASLFAYQNDLERALADA